MTAPLSSVTGLISGFNSQDLVDAIIARARVPAVRMEAEIATLRARSSALGTYRGLLDALRSAARTLRTGAAFDATTATTTVLSGSRPVATVTTAVGASGGQFLLTVATLARAEKLSATGQPDASAALGLSGGFRVNGQLVDVAAGDSLTSIRDHLNALNTGATPTGVSAQILSVSATDNRLILTSAATGAAGITLADETGTVLQQLGLLDGAGAKPLSAILTSGADASFRIDDIPLTRSSNVISDALAGVTLTLTSDEPGAVTSVSVGRFGDAAKSALQQFVDAYNGLVSFLKAQGTAATTPPPLYGDALLRSARSALPSLLLSAVGGAAADLATVARAGLSLTRDGLLSLDTAALDAVFTSRYDDLRTLFTEQRHASGSGVSLVSSGANPSGGTWAVDITAVATQATLVSGGFSGVYDDGGTADTLTVTDAASGHSVSVGLTSGMTTTQIRDALQQAFDAQGLGLVALVEGSELRISSTAYGSHAGILVDVTGTGDGASELFGAPLSAFGTDVAGTLGGEAATGSGQILVGNGGTGAAGISVLYTGGVTGAVGDVSVGLGAGARVERLLDAYLNTGDGLLDSKLAQLDARSARLQDRITVIDAQLALRRELLLKGFLQMESAIARLKQQSSSLLSSFTPKQSS